MSFIYCNVHPKGLRVGDCVKRAITKTTGKDYMEVQRELNRYKKKTGAAKFNSRDNWASYLEEELKATPIKSLSSVIDAPFLSFGALFSGFFTVFFFSGGIFIL